MKKNYRAMKFYKSLTNYMAVATAEGFGPGEGATEEQQLCAWQYISDKKMWTGLQGWFGRTVHSLLEQGIIAK